MVKEILIYIEGDIKQKGKGNAITLRQGFSRFFSGLAEQINVPIKLKLLGPREETIKIFLAEFNDNPQSLAILLVDSETEIGDDEAPKNFLKKISRKFDFRKVRDEQCHLMVQTMETWFLADKTALAEFYGGGFNEKALPKNPQIEKIAKPDVLKGLEKATHRTTKGKYGKGAHSGELLQKINSEKVCESAPHCERLFQTILEAVG